MSHTIDLSDNRLAVTVVGSISTAERRVITAETASSVIENGPVAVLTNAGRARFHYSVSEALMSASTLWRVASRSLVAHALIVDDSMTDTGEVWESIRRQRGIQARAFTSPTDAEGWLEEQISARALGSLSTVVL